MGLQMPRFSLLLKQNQKSFSITWSFQCIFSIAIRTAPSMCSF